MTPVMLHADGSECHHEGAPQRQATTAGNDLPLCPGGQPVPHIRLGDKVIPTGEALAAFRSMAEAITAYAEFARGLLADPHIRVLAAAAEAMRQERDAEEAGHAAP